MCQSQIRGDYSITVGWPLAKTNQLERLLPISLWVVVKNGMWNGALWNENEME